MIHSTKDIMPIVQRKFQKNARQAANSESSANRMARISEIGFGATDDACCPAVKNDFMSFHKWPTKLMSLMHPFNVDPDLDENLEHYFNINIPLLDFRVGV